MVHVRDCTPYSESPLTWFRALFRGIFPVRAMDQGPKGGLNLDTQNLDILSFVFYARQIQKRGPKGGVPIISPYLEHIQEDAMGCISLQSSTYKISRAHHSNKGEQKGGKKGSIYLPSTPVLFFTRARQIPQLQNMTHFRGVIQPSNWVDDSQSGRVYIYTTIPHQDIPWGNKYHLAHNSSKRGVEKGSIYPPIRPSFVFYARAYIYRDTSYFRYLQIMT